MDYQCIICQQRALNDRLEKLNVSAKVRKNLNRQFNLYMAESGNTVSAPVGAREISRLIKNQTLLSDPYAKEKRIINDYMMDLFPVLEKDIESSPNRFNKALRLAIAGNIIDNIANPDFNINATINHVLSNDFRIDHSSALFDRIQKAKMILYLGDNAGEIVLDKLFIKTINHPAVIYAVRGAEVINDATLSDAEAVGMKEVASLISNGSDAPSTILDDVSEEFIYLFNKADLIISKGQGNFEGLLNDNSGKIFFLFMVKCKVIGDIINAEVGDFVVMNKVILK